MQTAFVVCVVRSLKTHTADAFFEGIMNPLKNFRDLSRFELCLWITSVAVIVLSFVLSGGGDYLTMTASLIGVTALIFVAKGYVLGQVLTVVFSVFYGIVSFYFRYYGEMITYLGMTTPSALAAVISWLRHPYEGTKEVKVNHLNAGLWILLVLLTAGITAAFFFILSAIGNANIFFSTVSVTTSFIASYLTFFRNQYYALAYAANDVVLIVLWTLAAIESISYLPMVACFIMFLVNDLYGFYNWQRMKKKQNGQ